MRRSVNTTWVPLIVVFAAGLAAAQPTATRIVDLYPGVRGAGSVSSPFVAVGSVAYFVASEPATGAELWKTDGTPAGTTLAVDLTAGQFGSSLTHLFSSGGSLYFVNRGAQDVIYRSDGTPTGTVALRSFVSGSIGMPVEFGGAVYFLAKDVGVTVAQLWRSDGTPVGTTLVAGGVNAIGAAGSNLFLNKTDASLGAELFRYDGSTVTLVKDIQVGATGSNPQALTAVGTTLFFSANNGTNGIELWKSDGTDVGTSLVKDITVGAAGTPLTNLVASQGKLAFVVSSAQLWQSDGTALGTVIVKNLASSSFGAIFQLTPTSTMLFFSFYEPNTGSELWRSDGTDVGTFVLQARPGPASGIPQTLLASGATLYFSADDGLSGQELWRSDGSSAGTVLAADIYPGGRSSWPNYFGMLGTTLLLSAARRDVGSEPHATDGTPAGTVLLRDINPSTSIDSSLPSDLWASGGDVYFNADTEEFGRELWRTDGTAAGTVLVRDVYAGAIGSYPSEVVAAGGILYFAAEDYLDGVELWRTDGTAGNTLQVEDIRPGGLGSFPRDLTPHGAKLAFAARRNDGANEPWLSDGTANGTQRIPTGVSPLSASGFASAGGNLFFEAANVLYKYDGVLDAAPVPPGVEIDRLPIVAVGSRVYFASFTANEGAELAQSDGSAVTINDLQPGTGSSFPRNLTAAGPLLYFSASVDSDREPWIHDGVTASLLKDINPGVDGSSPRNFTAVGGIVFFTATDAVNGTELWRTDGTTAGTSLVKDLAPGTASSFPGNLVPYGNHLLFSASDETGTRRLWITDGTAQRTVVRMAFDPPTTNYLGNATATATHVVFTAIDAALDWELWGFPRDLTPPQVTQAVSGPIGLDGWYRGDVDVSFNVSEPEFAPLLEVVGCEPAQVTQDAAEVLIGCRASSEGGAASADVVLKRDATPPVAECPAPITAAAADPRGAQVFFSAATVTDATSGLASLSASAEPGAFFPVRDNAVTFTATDRAGNQATCDLQIRVVDSSAPILSCADLDVEATSNDGAAVTFNCDATDQVDTEVIPTFVRSDGASNDAVFPVGTTEVAATATDDSGNSDTATFSVLVRPPPITTRVSYYSFGCAAAPVSSVGAAPLLMAVLALLVTRRQRVAVARWRPGAAIVAVAVIAFPLVARATGAAPNPQAPAARQKLAFMGLRGSQGVTAEEVRSVSDSLETALSGIPGYEVISANTIATLVGIERQRQLMGCSDDAESCLAEITGALDAARIVSGDLSRVGETVVLNVSLVDGRVGRALARLSRTVQTGRSLEPLLDELLGVAYALANADAGRPGPPLKLERGFGGIVVGLRSDADLLAPGANITPAVTAEISSKRFGASVSILTKKMPGLRLEARYFPLEVGRLRPYAALGGTGFPAGLSARGAFGAAFRVDRFNFFVDVAYELFLLQATTGQPYFPQAGLVGAGFGYAL